MKSFICFCNFDSVDDWHVSCSSVEEARDLFLKYLKSRWSEEFITWISIYELVHVEDFDV